jgi:hypothetical protein
MKFTKNLNQQAPFLRQQEETPTKEHSRAAARDVEQGAQ